MPVSVCLSPVPRPRFPRLRQGKNTCGEKGPADSVYFPAAFPVRVEGSDGQVPVELTEGEDAVVLPAVFDEAVDIVIAGKPTRAASSAVLPKYAVLMLAQMMAPRHMGQG